MANSSIVASIWWNLPKTVFMFIASGSKPWASEKPPKTSIRLPAAATAGEEQVGHEAHGRADQHLGHAR